jgi:hypothetical protein
MNAMRLHTPKILRTNFKKPKSLQLVLLVVIVGCSTPGRLRVQRDESYQGKLEQVLIVYNPENTKASLGRDFSDRLVGQLRDSFARHNISAESVQFDNSALDRSAPVRAAESRFRPTQLMYFRIARLNTDSSMTWMSADQFPRFSNTMVVTLDFEIVDSKTNKSIWHANLDYFSAPDPKQVINQITDNMRVAGLL